MLKPVALSIFVALIVAILPGMATTAYTDAIEGLRAVTGGGQAEQAGGVGEARFARLRRGINASHWFAQAVNKDYSKAHLETHTTAQDIALIEAMGFDHVRLSVEPAPLFNAAEPGALNTEYVGYLDRAIDMILARGLAVIVDIHPSDEFKLKLNTDDHQVEAFAWFWRVLARHLSTRDPGRLFLEVLNEPTVTDGYRWAGIQAKVIAAIREGAPRHTIIAAGHRWSGIYELLFLEPVADRNVIYNFHFYEPMTFTHQGATWAGPFLPLYKEVPYPSSPDAVTRLMGTIVDEPARYHLLRYGEERWGASRIEAEIAMAAAWAKKHHVRLTCNEFGVFRQFAAPAARTAWIRDVRSALEKNGIGWTMWDYAGGFAVVSRKDGRAVPDAETVAALGLKLPGDKARTPE